MTVLEKAQELQRQLNLANSDISYSLSVSWGNDKEAEIKNMLILIKSTIELFSTDRIQQLDYDVRNEAFSNYDKQLENALIKFPEYRAKKQEEALNESPRK